MKKSRFTDSQIMAILKQGEGGIPVAEICREDRSDKLRPPLSLAFKIRRMDASLIARLKEQERENAQLKKMYAEERLKAEIAQEALSKKW